VKFVFNSFNDGFVNPFTTFFDFFWTNSPSESNDLNSDLKQLSGIFHKNLKLIFNLVLF